MNYNPDLNWVRLPLTHGNNFRELGGYPAEDGRMIKYHRFIRASSTSHLDEEDIAFLRAYGVVADIDLRSEAECYASPDKMNNTDGILYKIIPFSGDMKVDTDNLAYQQVTLSMAKLYIRDMIEQHEAIRNIFTFIAHAPEGCILFHCHAGKDHTGILAMLLMYLAGADKEDCMTNYEQSFSNLRRGSIFFASHLANQSDPDYSEFLYSKPDTILQVYEFIERKYAGIMPYLLDCGVSWDDIQLVKSRLLDD